MDLKALNCVWHDKHCLKSLSSEFRLWTSSVVGFFLYVQSILLLQKLNVSLKDMKTLNIFTLSFLSVLSIKLIFLQTVLCEDI